MTNYEKIKNMTIEEMAEFFGEFLGMFIYTDKFTNCDSRIKYLESEAEE